MCAFIKKRNELDLVRSLMRMSLMAVIAESVNCDMDQIQSCDNLRIELKMDKSALSSLADRVADIFDSSRPDMEKIKTVADLMKLIVDDEFSDITEHLAANHRHQPDMSPAA